MSELYTVMLAVLAILAISGLYVGVTNDAVNFLNAAIGSKVAKMKTILLVASVGIILGVLTSSGMMEVARSGMFNPGLFTFHEIMILYVSVMFANVILLDIYNSLGLPTSTTVALVFSLLGAAIAVSLYKISHDAALSLGSLGGFINTTRAMGVISAILLSVIIAFVFGTLVMWISRFIFSFRYLNIFRRWGALWCGASFTAIAYFAVFKALKGVLSTTALYAWISDNLLLAVILCWIFCSVVLAFLQLFRINILRINILTGTFALALAFAGNDLVNFIGVPIAGLDAYNIAKEAGSTTILMEGLNQNLPAQFIWMLLSGVVMVLTLWTSTKSMNVSQTEISLAGQGDDMVTGEQDSNVFSRSIVRASINISNFFDKVTPESVKEFVGKRFEYEDVEKNGAPYDKIRAVVNLTTAALLISVGTSFKLPLSTTYVCFMVAMGSSLADKAWGRESAVYRITGVITVVMGWFVTGIGAFIIAIVVGLLLIWGGTPAFVVVTIACAYMLIKSNFKSSKKSDSMPEVVTENNQVENVIGEVCSMMKVSTQIYDRTLVAVLKEDRKALKELVRESKEMYDESHKIKYSLMPALRKMKGSGLELSLYYIQVVDYLNEMAKALVHITKPAFEHIDNNHKGLSQEQTDDLMHINDDVAEIYGNINRMITTNDFSDIDTVLMMRDALFERIVLTTKSELKRINAGEGNTKASMFYLTVMSETKAMVLQARNLLKAQRYFLEHAGGNKYRI
ncbi:MAG: inorganic phosphate transporter [Alistipes sp.]|nr:inorganic phosphate transporter [Alistipes sp.]MBP3564501.1 inorganic phosphate transporter [Alistipes sp.]